MPYEIYTRGEITITPALPEDLAERIKAFTQADHEGKETAIPLPKDEYGNTLRFCDWLLTQGWSDTTLEPHQPTTTGWDAWLGYLIAWINAESPGHIFEGRLYWDGDGHDDRGRVLVESDGRVVVQEEVEAVYKGTPEALWLEVVRDYLNGQPPTGLGRLLTIWTEEDLAVKYAEAVCKDCRDGTCERVADEHDLSVYWDLPEERKTELVQKAVNVLCENSVIEAAYDALVSVVEMEVSPGA